MLISVATANYYFIPFEQTLEIIGLAGFEFIELDLYWERKNWAMAQHLRGIDPREVVRMINQSGLKVSSIHDGGGVLEYPGSGKNVCDLGVCASGWVNPQLDCYLDHLGYAPGCLVFHTPHIEGNLDGSWWQVFWIEGIKSLDPYRSACQAVTVENMPFFEGYSVPLTAPEQLADFTRAAGLHVTLDTTHYAQIGVDICQAAQALNGAIKTVHLSDYAAGKTHVFPEDGELDLGLFFQTLDAAALHSVTLECSPGFLGEDPRQLSTPGMINRLRTARSRVEQLIITNMNSG